MIITQVGKEIKINQKRIIHFKRVIIKRKRVFFLLGNRIVSYVLNKHRYKYNKLS